MIGMMVKLFFHFVVNYVYGSYWRNGFKAIWCDRSFFQFSYMCYVEHFWVPYGLQELWVVSYHGSLVHRQIFCLGRGCCLRSPLGTKIVAIPEFFNNMYFLMFLCTLWMLMDDFLHLLVLGILMDGFVHPLVFHGCLWMVLCALCMLMVFSVCILCALVGYMLWWYR